MRTIQWRPKVLALVVILIFTCVTVLLMYTAPSTSTHHIHRSEAYTRQFTSPSQLKKSRHKLAVIVPFRDRFEELMEFVPHMHSFLTNASLDYQIYVINQADRLRFNRAALINIGYKMSVLQCDYLVMHDVDLLPLNPLLNYSYPDNHVFHVAAPFLHPLYHYEKFVGGILILKHADFNLVNGLSNRYWGWGREDDEFYVRIKEAHLTIKRPDPAEITTGYNTFRHVHDRIRRPRDGRRYGNQKEAGSHRDRKTGLHDVDYTLTEVYPITIHNAPAKVYNVELNCDTSDTPWCETPR